jgi:hypothetical protein
VLRARKAASALREQDGTEALIGRLDSEGGAMLLCVVSRVEGGDEIFADAGDEIVVRQRLDVPSSAPS